MAPPARGARVWLLCALAALWLLSGCATLDDTAGDAGDGSFSVGNNSIDEACRVVPSSRKPDGAGAGATASNVYCGKWEEPSARVFRVHDASSLEDLATQGWWRNHLETTANCGPPVATNILGGVEAVAVDCRFRNGGWPYQAVATRIGDEVYLAESIPAAYSTTERAIGVLSGRRSVKEPEVAGETSAEIQRLESRLAGEHYSAGDMGKYQDLLRLAQYHNFHGAFPEAEQRYRQAMDLQRKVMPGDYGNWAFLDMHIALELSNQGRFDIADAVFKEADKLILHSLEPTDESRLVSYKALHLANQRHDEEALTYARKATELRRDLAERYGYRPASETMVTSSSLPGDAMRQGMVGSTLMHPRAATALGDVVQSRFLEGAMLLELKRLDEARDAVNEAKMMLEEEPRVPRQWLPQIYLLEARIAESAGDLAAAEARVLDSIETRRALFSQSRTEGLTYLFLGRVLSKQNRPQEALAAFYTGFDILRRQKAGVRLDDVAPFLNTALAEAGKNPDQRPELMRQMFLAAQMVRGSVVGQTLALTTARLASGEHEVGILIRDLQDARYQRDQLKAQLTVAQANPRVLATQVKDLETKYQAMDEKVGSLEQQVQAAAPRYNQLLDDPVTKDDVSGVLHPGEAVVQILIGEESSYGFLLDSDGAEAYQIELGEAEAGKMVKILRAPLEARVDPPLRFPAAAAFKLYTQLFAPVRERITKAEHIIIVPSKSLLSMPFGILVEEKPPWISGGDYSGVAWMTLNHSLTVAPSVHSFVNLRRGRHSDAKSPFIGFGDFVPLGETLASDRRNLDLPQACQAEFLQLVQAGRLPNTAYEIKQVAEVIGAPQSSVVLGQDFTDNHVKTMELDNYRIVYFATHGLLPYTLNCFPEPGLLVSGGEPSDTSGDGLLTSSEIVDLKLDADLVVLSACDTGGPGLENGGEALSGLARAFFYAGARSLLVTHWEIPDKPTMELLTATFRRLSNEHETLAEALRGAQTEMVHNAASSHPLNWGAFCVVGDGGRGLEGSS